MSNQDGHCDPPCRDLDRWVVESTRASRNNGGIVRMGLDVKHRCDGRTHPTPRQGEQAVLFWGRPAMANAVASGRESACPRSCCRASTRSAAAELNGAIAYVADSSEGWRVLRRRSDGAGRGDGASALPRSGSSGPGRRAIAFAKIRAPHRRGVTTKGRLRCIGSAPVRTHSCAPRYRLRGRLSRRWSCRQRSGRVSAHLRTLTREWCRRPDR